MNKTKICISCKKRKLRTAFYPRNEENNKGWVTSECKKCTQVNRKKRYEKKLNRLVGTHAKKYTESEIELLKTMYLSGKSYIQICKRFPNRSKHALESKLSELSIAGTRNYLLKRKTKIEEIVETWLKQFNYIYEDQKIISRMVVDFCVNNIVIEVQGSYWHCDKKLYPNGPIYELQEKNIYRDTMRKNKLIALGYNILYVWEYDIEHNPEETQKTFQAVLNSNIWNDNRPISVELLRD